jgi:hypothetical protein
MNVFNKNKFLYQKDRLRVTNRSGDRAKQRLTDEVEEYRKKLREQQKANKDLDDKYVRVKDCLYKTKSYLNRALDEVSDTLKRGQPVPAPPPPTPSASSTAADGKASASASAKQSGATTVAAKSSTDEEVKTEVAESGSAKAPAEQEGENSAAVAVDADQAPAPPASETALIENLDLTEFDGNLNDNSLNIMDINDQLNEYANDNFDQV